MGKIYLKAIRVTFFQYVIHDQRMSKGAWRTGGSIFWWGPSNRSPLKLVTSKREGLWRIRMFVEVLGTSGRGRCQILRFLGEFFSDRWCFFTGQRADSMVAQHGSLNSQTSCFNKILLKKSKNHFKNNFT